MSLPPHLIRIIVVSNLSYVSINYENAAIIQHWKSQKETRSALNFFRTKMRVKLGDKDRIKERLIKLDWKMFIAY